MTLIYRKIILQRREYRTKTEEAIREFREGMKKKSLQLQKEREANQASFFNSGLFQRKRDKMGDIIQDNDGHDCNGHILELPYDDRFEVERGKWNIGKSLKFTHILGPLDFSFMCQRVLLIIHARFQHILERFLRTYYHLLRFMFGLLTFYARFTIVLQ